MSHCGLILRIDGETQQENKERLDKVLNVLVQRGEEFSIHKSFNEHGWLVWEVRVKSLWNEFIYPVQMAFGIRSFKQWEEAAKEISMCERDGCFNEAFDASINGYLFDKHGEELYHWIHDVCAAHTNLTARTIAKSLEVFDLTPEEPEYKDRALVWKLRNHWYSQRTEDYQDGDYEGGYFNCTKASEWLGPFEDKQLAYVAAKDYEFKY